MNLFYFCNPKALESTIKSGLIPQKVLQSSAHYQQNNDGSILINSKQKIEKKQQAKLSALGLLSDKKHEPDKSVTVQHWAEIVAPQKNKIEQIDLSLVLFKIEKLDSLQHISHELLRLGCDRQSFYQLETIDGDKLLFLRVVSPPYFTVLKALEKQLNTKMFIPVVNGQEQVWVEAGYQHQVLDSIKLNSSKIVLIEGSGRWEYFPQGEWTRLYDLLDVRVNAAVDQTLSAVSPQRIQVAIRLVAKGREESPSLWLIRDNAIAVVENLIARMPDKELAAITFAVAKQQDRSIIILKRRPNWHKQVFLEIDTHSCVTCAAWAGIENLYIPDSAILEPPLRRDKLKEIFAADPELITIITESDTAGIVDIYKIEHRSFQLLEDWVDYSIAKNNLLLTPWVKSCSFDFKDFESIGTEWSEFARNNQQNIDKQKGPKPEPKNKQESEQATQANPKKRTILTAPPKKKVGFNWAARLDTPVQQGAEEKKLAELEQQFLALNETAADPIRMPLWHGLAQCYGRLQKPKEAAHCWVRLMWLDEVEETVIEQWLIAERMALGYKADAEKLVERLVEEENPSAQQVRLVAVELIAQIDETNNLAMIKQWLDQHDALLDVRTLWLVRLQLSKNSDDLLQLVDARDRILARLSNGLSLEKDIPGFMRFCGSREGDSLTVFRLQNELQRLLAFYNKTKRNSSTLEAAKKLTDAYVFYVFSWGFARLNKLEKADELIQRARKLLKIEDSVHGVLVTLFEARIQQAREAIAKESPLDSHALTLLEQLERFDRYKVDRLRQASTILEPQERIDPIHAYQVNQGDARGEEFLALSQLSDRRQLIVEIDKLLVQAYSKNTKHQDKARLLDGIMDFFPRLGEAEAIPRLLRIVDELQQLEPLLRCAVLEDALLLAGFFSRQDIVSKLIDEIDRLLSQVKGENLDRVANTLAQFVSSLRRVGLFEQGLHILEKAYARFDNQQADTIVTRIQLASGFADMNNQDKLDKVFLEGGEILAQPQVSLEQRLKITYALSDASSHMVQDTAITKLHDLAQQLSSITDSYNTNSHFCLSVISFIESLVLGFANDKLVLGDLGGKWLGEDELLVRQKIQQDLQTMY